jgi:hypothetical protein
VGELAVSVHVNGDPLLVAGAYLIYVDGKTWGIAQPNEILTQRINSGSHQIIVTKWTSPQFCILGSCTNPYASILNLWCGQARENPQSAAVEEGRTQTVTFEVDCPPLVGEGVVAFRVESTGTSVPAEFPVVITRLSHGPAYSRTVNVPANASVESIVPVGVHRFSINSSGRCRSTIADISASTITGIVRDGQEVRATLRVTCD